MIKYNKNLTSLSGFSSLTSVGGDLRISGNYYLTSLFGLRNANFRKHVTISNNRNLSVCEIQSICSLIASEPQKVDIHNNLGNCAEKAAVAAACTSCAGSTSPPFWFKDEDGDGYGQAGDSQVNCVQPTGYVALSGDCVDVLATGAAINPGMAEIPNNSIDDNCNGLIDENFRHVDVGDDLQAAITAANAAITANPSGFPDGIELWVQAGEYAPPTTAGFDLKNKVSLYGGFSGTETQRDQRDVMANKTTLSGSAVGALHVIQGNGLDATAVLDGFIIEDGHASVGNANNSRGGGIFLINSSPTIRNCIIRNNDAKNEGGGVYCKNSSPTFINCLFYGNKCTSTGAKSKGGGLYFTGTGTAHLINCTISDNTSTKPGAGIHNKTTALELKNTIVYGNLTTEIEGTGPRTYLKCIINDAALASNPQVDTNNPEFVDAHNHDFRLKATSPAKNTGDDAVNAESKDLDGKVRKNGQIDVGAYERD